MQATKQQLKGNEQKKELTDADLLDKRIVIKLRNPEGEFIEQNIDLPINTTVQELEAILNKLLQNTDDQLYSFFFETIEIKNTLKDFVQKLTNFTTESAFPITYHPQSLFFVRPITRQSSSLPGHTDSVLSVLFSPDGNNLASCGGDTTVRFWDVLTQTPHFTCEKAHTNWVMVISWSPDGKMLASGGNDNNVVLWDPLTGEQIGQTMSGHTKWITSFAWEPLHKNKKCELLASSSKDTTVRIWHTPTQDMLVCISGHAKCVTKVLWGGEDLIYTASEDTLVQVWEKSGQIVKELKTHAHWVNTLCCNTDYVLRTGAFDETNQEFKNEDEMFARAKERYLQAKGVGNERIVSGSDDFTLVLWDAKVSAQPIVRMTGHQQPINHTQFSPDGRFIISASFDQSLRLWDGYNGTYLATFRGHVGAVYQIAWSSDSRLFVSGSKDSTMKVWDIKTKKLMFDLPGHADEVYAVDWSPDGEKVASGGQDRLLKIWKN